MVNTVVVQVSAAAAGSPKALASVAISLKSNIGDNMVNMPWITASQFTIVKEFSSLFGLRT